MRILILGLNYWPEPVGIGPYTTDLAEALVAMGHKVEVVAGKPYYPKWQAHPDFLAPGSKRSIEQGVEVTRVPIYIPPHATGIRRIMHHLSFALSALVPACKSALKFRPDVVFVVAPSLLAVPVARLAANLSGAKMWLHFQDLEVEAAFATGLLSRKSIIGWLAKRFDNIVTRMADRLSAISPQMCHKLEAKTSAPVTEFRNWADLECKFPSPSTSSFRKQWSLGSAHVALYSGNIANKQGIEIIVDAAALLEKRSDIMFIVCGNGASREAIVKLAGKSPNLLFFDLQPKERLGELLGLASVHLLPQLGGAADLVLPSKLTNILASGRPVVVTAEAGTGLAEETKGCGAIVPPGDASAFASAVEWLIDSRDDARSMGRNARCRAEERWSKKSVIGAFAAELEAV